MTFIHRLLPNLRIRNQLLLIVFIITVCIIFTFLLWNYYQYYYVSQIFINGSNKIFRNSQKSYLNISTNAYQDYFKKIFALNGNQLISFHRVYTELRKQVQMNDLNPINTYQMNYEGIIQIPDPLRLLNQYNANISYSFMCYTNTSAYSDPLTQNEKIGIKLQEQIQAIGQILFFGIESMQLNIYSYIVSEKINNIYPCVNRGEKIYIYNPEKRDWYIQLEEVYKSQEQYSKYLVTFTPPFQLFTQQTLGLSMTLPIVDNNLNFIGGVASSLIGNNLISYMSDYKTGNQQVYLVSLNGTLIMHPFNVQQSDLPLSFYNESLTGFNRTDWIEILKQQDGISNCKNDVLSFNIKCRYNSKYKQDFFIGFLNLTDYSLYLIVIKNNEEFIEFADRFNLTFQNNLLSSTVEQFLICLSIFILASLIIFIYSSIIFYPLILMTRVTRQQITQGALFEILLPPFYQKFIGDQIRQLLISQKQVYQSIEQLSLIKTQECIDIEKRQYPQTTLLLTPLLNFNNKQFSPNIKKQQNWNKFKNYIIDQEKLKSCYFCIIQKIKSQQLNQNISGQNQTSIEK